MKAYIVITTDGFTEDDRYESTEMCQVICKCEAKNADEAAEIARRVLTEWGYVYPNLRVYELVSFEALDTHGTFRDEDED